MAAKGDKIGDAYIEVHLDTDSKTIKANEAKVQKSIDKNLQANISAQQQFDKFKKKSFSADLDHSLRLIAGQERLQKIEKARIDEIDKLHGQAFTQELKRIEKIDQAHGAAIGEKIRRESSAAKKQKDLFIEVEKAHRQALKIMADREEKARKDRIRRRGGGRGGSNNRGEGFLGASADVLRNVSSILPGQLEKVFANPAVAAAGAVLGANLLAGAGGAIAAGTGVAALGGGIAIAIARNPFLQALGRDLGANFADNFGEAAEQNIGKATELAILQVRNSGLAERLSAQFADTLSALAPELGPFVGKISNGVETVSAAFNDLAQNSGPLIQALGDGFGEVSDDVAAFFNDLKDNLPEIKSALSSVLSGTSNVINALGKITVGAANGLDKFTDSFSKFNAARSGGGTSAIAEAGNELEENIKLYQRALEIQKQGEGAGGFVTGLLFGASDPKKLADGEKTITLQSRLNELLGQQAAEAAAVDKSALGAASSTGTFMSSSLGLAAAQADVAFQLQQSYAAQRAFDSSIVTSQDHLIAHEQAVDDIAAAVKDVGKGWSLSKPEVRNAIKVAETSLGSYKSALLTAVEQGKITREQAISNFNKMAAEASAKFGPGSAARRAIDETIATLRNFPDDINISIDVNTGPAHRALDALINKIGTARQKAEAQKSASADHATGGAIRGPGTGTSDSIPANLSNGEYVIKASSAKKIGMSNLAAMNATGRMPMGFASGGSPSQGRGKTTAQVAEFNRLTAQIANLTKVIGQQTAALTKYTQQISQITQALDQNASLGNQDTSSGTAFLKSLQSKRTQNQDFVKNLASLKKRGLGQQGLEQLAAAGPDSPLGKLLGTQLSNSDLQRINALLGGDAAGGLAAANILNPGGAGLKRSVAANKASLAAKNKKRNALKAPAAKGASIRFVKGKPQAFFSSKELADQNLKKDTYVTVIIDGKEVRAIVKQEQKKATTKSNSNLRSGRR